MASETTVLIVNWNGAAFLDSLLQSVRGENPKEIIVVDNGSTDSSAEILSRYPDITTILNGKNLGFGAAANQGIERSETPFVLLLNADVEVLSGTIDLLERFLVENRDTAVVAPRLLFPNGVLQPSCRTFPTVTKCFLFLTYLDYLIPVGYRLSQESHSRKREVDQPMGAALMIRKSVLERIGLFDSQFFLYMEEVDLCERIKTAGWKIWYLPEAKMIHHGGGSSRQDWERSQSDYLRSLVRYFRKRSPSIKVIMLKCSLSLALLIRSMVLLLCGRFHQSRFYLSVAPRVFSL